MFAFGQTESSKAWESVYCTTALLLHSDGTNHYR